ncbi:acyl-CoA dehydrogenase family protein [Streptomyces spirodelae]|uniref:Acyl-CoA oxidase C-alpha1 domain-containing protein n=1 Tax=Streptomyces spirodelae TaxID=2812904 RepID=A0ABS3WXB9_9ACTN|nr:hypothetical protein [Streptomyces spirodelae]MBO8187719.1 hypothetical protein [Streptomyces spirodelae]
MTRPATDPPATAPAPPQPFTDPLRTPRAQRIAEALGPVRPPEPGESTSRNQLTHHALARLAAVLPPARQLLHDRSLLAELSACTALMDPALYMTVVNHYFLCLGSVVASADERQQAAPELARVVEELESGRRKGVFLVTEIGDATSHLALRTTAEFDPRNREFVLTTPDPGAAKCSAVGTPGSAQSAVVCARLRVGGRDHGVHPFLVDLCDERRTAPGVSLSGALGAETLPLEYALVRFEGARLPYDRWLRGEARIDADGAFRDPHGDPGRALQRTLDVGRALWATVPSAAAATARASAASTLRHSRHRRSHGRLAPEAPVLSYSTQQRAVLGALAEAFALDCASRTALDIWQQSEKARTDPNASPTTETAFSPWAAVDRRLSAFKALAVAGAVRVTAECRRRCGLAGHLTVNRLSGYAGLAEAFGAAGGDNQLILLDIGRALAEEEAPAPADGTSRPAGTDDPAWWLWTVSALEQRLTAGLRAALDERRQRAPEGMDLWNPLLEQARQLGEVHTLRLAAQSVADATRTADDTDPAAAALAALYGTGQALRLAGPLLWTGVLSPGAAAVLEAAADRQCARLMSSLDTLTARLAPPNALVPVPLAASDYAAALAATADRTPGGCS